METAFVRNPNAPMGSLDTDENFDFKKGYFKMKEALKKANGKIGRQRSNLKHCSNKIAAQDKWLMSSSSHIASLENLLNTFEEKETKLLESKVGDKNAA